MSLKSKKTTVTSLASSSSPSSSSTNYDSRMDLDSVRSVILSVNKYFHQSISNPNYHNHLKHKCSSFLNNQHQSLEFSHHTILSNLYWGMDAVQAATSAQSSDNRHSRLTDAEKMLQVPALLAEDEETAGIPNTYLVCIAYVYLSLVKRLQREDWQVAMHFLQAVLVSPRLVRRILAPQLCEFLFPSSSSSSSSSSSFGDEAMKRLARRYRDWLMYYQVMLYGENFVIGDCDYESRYSSIDKVSMNTDYSYLVDTGDSLIAVPELSKRHSGDAWDDDAVEKGLEIEIMDMELSQHREEDLRHLGKVAEIGDEDGGDKIKASMKRLQDMLNEPQSDTSSMAAHSPPWGSIEEGDFEEDKATESGVVKDAVNSQLEIIEWNQQEPCSTSDAADEEELCELTFTRSLRHLLISSNSAITGVNTANSTIGDFNLSVLELRDRKHAEDSKLTMIQRTSEPQELQLFDQIAATKKRKSCNMSNNNLSKKETQTDLLGIFEKAISKLCFTKMDEESVSEITAIYKMLSNKSGVKYTMLKDVILDQLLTAISTSEEDRVVRISVSILTTIVQANQSVLTDIKRKGLRLRDLATALKRNVPEAATLIYLINPSPTEIKTLEILPTLVEVICCWSSSKFEEPTILLTPPVASLMIIEVLVTAFDYNTNTMHLAEISSPRVLHGLLDVARDTKAEEAISLATVIVKCMQFDGKCRIYISQFTPVAPFISLLQSNKKRAKFLALEFFHEILCMPRSAAICLLQKICDEGGATLMQNLMLCLQKLPSPYRLFAANLLIQLETLQQENASSRGMFSEGAVHVLLSALTSEESSMEQQLSAFILSNLGGTYSWTGEPYTVAWLVRKAGLTSPYYRNMVKDFDWDDQSLEDTEMDSWCSKVARSVIANGKPVFETLAKGLKSKTKRVSRDCLTAIAWLGCEISRSPHNLRYSACEMLIGGLEQFLHPGIYLEERLLACMCIYNYASGKGMQKLINFSEGVRESLRRFSSITWMAEELHKVADYYLPNKSRISCVHTQILEAGQNAGSAVNALIYYKGLLWSGHSDGSIKVWDIIGQTTSLVWDNKEHKKAVTCFSLFEQGESLLSGSSDKTIKVWKMVRGNLECVEVIWTKEPIQQLGTCGNTIFVVPQGHGVKVIDSTRTVKEICKRRSVKSMNLTHGKIYVGCKDSSIQELALANYREREIKASARRWIMQKRPITSIMVYKDWVYTASSVVEGSNMKEWRRSSEAQTKIVVEKGANIIAMGVVEDFIYLTSSSSPSVLQIWLRGRPQKAGRISAGSRITCLLTANDKVLCGTEAGLIKGWIPL